MRRVRRLFDRLLQRARVYAPGLNIQLRVGPAEHFPEPRNMAYCAMSSAGQLVVTVAPDFGEQPADRIDAVLRHEIAHALAMHVGEFSHTERDADEIARRVFGRRIRYDRDMVQSLRRGVSPRPQKLG